MLTLSQAEYNGRNSHTHTHKCTYQKSNTNSKPFSDTMDNTLLSAHTQLQYACSIHINSGALHACSTVKTLVESSPIPGAFSHSRLGCELAVISCQEKGTSPSKLPTVIKASFVDVLPSRLSRNQKIYFDFKETSPLVRVTLSITYI